MLALGRALFFELYSSLRHKEFAFNHVLYTRFLSHHGWYTQIPFTVYTHECHVSFTWYMHSLITHLWWNILQVEFTLRNVVCSVTTALWEVIYNYTCCIARTGGGTHSYHRVDVQLDALTCARIRGTVLQVACGPGAPITLKPLACLQVCCRLRAVRALQSHWSHSPVYKCRRLPTIRTIDRSGPLERYWVNRKKWQEMMKMGGSMASWWLNV